MDAAAASQYGLLNDARISLPNYNYNYAYAHRTIAGLRNCATTSLLRDLHLVVIISFAACSNIGRYLHKICFIPREYEAVLIN